MSRELLRVESLCKTFTLKRSLFGGQAGGAMAVDNISFSIDRGET